MSAGRLVAIVPAWNEAGAIGGVVDEIRAFDPRIDVVVVDDASSDDTAAVAEPHGATVLGLPFNVGIGGAVQTGFRYARDEGYEVAVRLDGDGQHDASELGKLLGPIRRGRGRPRRRLALRRSGRDVPAAVRAPDRASASSRGSSRLLGGQRVTDTTSGFAALNRVGIELFAVEYPHDYPEVEATLVALRSGLRLTQVQVDMRERQAGTSSITFVRSLYYIVKVMLALLVASLRRYPRLEAARPMTPIRASDRRRRRLDHPDPRRRRARPRAAAEGALCAALARDGSRPARPLRSGARA